MKKIMSGFAGIIIFVCLLFSNVSANVIMNPSSIQNVSRLYRRTSYLAVTEEGFMRVCCNNAKKSFYVEYYDDNFKLLSKKEVDMELDLWGGFFDGADAYYIVEGTNNESEDDSAEVVRVIKYDKTWKRIGSASITGNDKSGGKVRYPFDAGCVEMKEYNDKLYIVTGHEGYRDANSSQGHQGFMMMEVDENTMTGNIIDADYYHSFAQYIDNKDSQFYVLELSEGARGTALSKFDASSPVRDDDFLTLKYGGSRTSEWAVKCYASVNGMALSTDSVLCVGTSIDQSLYDSAEETTSHNIYLTVTPFDNFSQNATKVKWLTSYENDGKSFLGLEITKINDDRFLITWEEALSENDTYYGNSSDGLAANVLHYVFVDGQGETVSEEFTTKATISDCKPVVKNGKAVFYSAVSNNVDFYSIDVNTGEFDKVVYRIAGENAVWEVEGLTLKVSGSGVVSVDISTLTRAPLSSAKTVMSYSFLDNVWKPIRGSVRKIIIKSGINEIQDEVFTYFTNLEEVEIESGLQKIGANVFAENENLAKITIPASVTEIGEDFLWSGYYKLDGKTHIVRAFIDTPEDSYAAQYADSNNISRVKSLSGAEVTLSEEKFSYTGKENEPYVTVTLDGMTLSKNSHYTIQYDNNVEPGTATITITGINLYKGSLKKEFTIERRSISNANVKGIYTDIFSGNALTPVPKITFDGVTLEKDVDYSVSYKDNINAGTASVVITGIGYYTGTLIKTFTISSKNINSASVSGIIAENTYTGQRIEQTPVVKMGETILEKNIDYTISYSDNTDVGNAKIYIKGINNYSQTIYESFKIVPLSMDMVQINDFKSYSYSGTAIKPEPVVTYNGVTLRKGTDYSVEYENNINVGDATVIITGMNNYTGTVSKTFKIEPNSIIIELGSIKNATISETNATFHFYTGQAIKPEIQVSMGNKTLTEGKDYTLTYENNINAGTAKVIVTGMGSYSGVASKEFTIIRKSILKADISGIDEKYYYTGDEISPKPVVTLDNEILSPDTDYSVTYSDNLNAGTATVTITGINNFNGSITKNFAIKKVSIENAQITMGTTFKYTGESIQPEVVIKIGSRVLEADKDYILYYFDNVDEGDASVVINGINNYTGSYIKSFKIVKNYVEPDTSTIEESTKEETTKEESTTEKTTKEETTKEESTKEETTKEESTTEPTTAEESKQEEETKESETKEDEKARISIETAAVTAKSKFVYKGKAVKPSPVVSIDGVLLTAGTDYKVSYKNNKQIGTAKMKITGIGNYSGIIYKSFKIIPKKAVLKALTRVSKGKLKIMVKKHKDATGYEIVYAANKNFKKKKVIQTTKNYIKIKGLKSGKTYYVKVRCYTEVKGKKYYGDYSAVKYIKV